MKSKHVLVAIISLCTLIAYSFKKTELVHTYDQGRSPCDAPLISAGWTGAPGDGTCASSGCHSGSINSGPGGPFLLIGNGDNLYTPGETYTVNLGLTQELIDKFGFQVTNRNGVNQFVGQNTLTDPDRTRLISAGKYVGSNACGSDVEPPGQITWEFEWTAPDNNEGEIIFYANFIATNHNHSSSGDDTYSMEISLQPNGATAISEHNFEAPVLYPNPTEDHLRLADIGILINYEIFNLSGIKIIKGTTSELIDVSTLNPGNYIIKFQIDHKTHISKFVKINY